MSNLRILLVDDSEPARRGLRSLLTSQKDFQITGEAADGVEAVDKAKQLRPDLVLMDVNMPRMNGLDATRAIRLELPETKVIIVSQNEPTVVQAQASKAKADGYVMKIDVGRDLVPEIRRVAHVSGHEIQAPPAIAAVACETSNGGTSNGPATHTLATNPVAGQTSSPAPRPQAAKPPHESENISPATSWLSDGGEMGALMRAQDWSTTPLGPAETWSPALRIMVKFMLANRFPQLLWWGPNFYSFYNDAYIPILGTKHPWALGRPVSKVWEEIWDVLKPLVERPYSGGGSTWMEDIHLVVKRLGFPEETHFTVAYSPVPDDTAPNGIGGVLATVHEITHKIVNERRMVALRELGRRSVEPRSAEDACKIAADILARHSSDVPFSMFYLLDETDENATLACSAGVDENDRGCPKSIPLSRRNSRTWPIAKAIETDDVVFVPDISQFFDRVPPGPWEELPTSAALVPIRSNKAQKLEGCVVVGVSSRLPFDHNYCDFLRLMATQFTTTLASARAFEEDRKRIEALAEIDRAKTAFFSNVSHEFRTPLTLMLGPLEDLLSRNRAHFGPAVKEQLDIVNRNASRLLRLVNSLLDFSRIEAGRVQAVYQATDVAALTTEIAGVFRSATDRAGLTLDVDCSALEQPVYVDREMWEKIVLNLLSNAFKFTFDGGITVRMRCSGDAAEMEVSDTGVGIPAHEMPRLFERFHRVPNAVSRTFEGSGIGLALVNELVKLHGGAIQASSEVGKGTTFRITVPFGQDHLNRSQIGGEPVVQSTATGARPFVEEALRWLPGNRTIDYDMIGATGAAVEPLALSAYARAEQGAKPMVLVADDNQDMRDYLTRLFSERFEVLTVADGVEAMRATHTIIPDLIVSDVMMPRMDGLELVREIREDAKLAQVPIILLSARAGEESRIEGMDRGADDYLVKPFSARELVARAEAHVKMNQMRIQGRHDQALLASQFRSLIDRAPIGIHLVDSQLRIRHVNPVAAPMFGAISNLVGRNFDDVVHQIWPAGYADEVIAAFRKTLATGETYLAPERAEPRVDRDTTEYYEWRIDRIVLPEGGFGVVCYFSDISAHVKARADLAASEERFRELVERLHAEVAERTAELEQRNAQLVRQSRIIEEVSARLTEVQDAERRRVARELHDSAGQTLAAISIGVAGARRLANDPKLIAEMDIVDANVKLLTKEIRTTSYLLHPPLLDELGIEGALRTYVDGLAQRGDLVITLDVSPDLQRLPHAIELTAFRVVQECLTNVHRHSGSKTAEIRVTRKPDDMVVEVRDRGRGISADRLAEINAGGTSVGMMGIRERVKHLKGEMTIDSNSAGTTVTVVLPVPPADTSVAAAD